MTLTQRCERLVTLATDLQRELRTFDGTINPTADFLIIEMLSEILHIARITTAEVRFGLQTPENDTHH